MFAAGPAAPDGDLMPCAPEDVVEEVVEEGEDPGCDVDYGEDDLVCLKDEGVRVRKGERGGGRDGGMGGMYAVGRYGRSVRELWDGRARDGDEGLSTHECSDDPRFVDGQVRREDGIPGHGWSSGSDPRSLSSEELVRGKPEKVETLGVLVCDDNVLEI